PAHRGQWLEDRRSAAPDGRRHDRLLRHRSQRLSRRDPAFQRSGGAEPHRRVIARERFEREGFVAGIPALTADELAFYRSKLLALYEALPEALHKHSINLHGVLDWAASLGRH